MNENNYFSSLNAIDVSSKTEKKNGLTYLSWAWAWGELKKRYPDATYTVYENRDGWNYFTDGNTCWVKTGVTVSGIEHIEYLPVMDFRNASIRADKVTSFDVNKAIQRSLTKAVARHGLGLYIYAGEDLPEDAEEPKDADDPRTLKAAPPPKSAPKPPKPQSAPTQPAQFKCEACGAVLKPYISPKTNEEIPVRRHAETSMKKFGKVLCLDCIGKEKANG